MGTAEDTVVPLNKLTSTLAFSLTSAECLLLLKFYFFTLEMSEHSFETLLQKTK
jgi:hypothetical protein